MNTRTTLLALGLAVSLVACNANMTGQSAPELGDGTWAGVHSASRPVDSDYALYAFFSPT